MGGIYLSSNFTLIILTLTFLSLCLRSQSRGGDAGGHLQSKTHEALALLGLTTGQHVPDNYR